MLRETSLLSTPSPSMFESKLASIIFQENGVHYNIRRPILSWETWTTQRLGKETAYHIHGARDGHGASLRRCTAIQAVMEQTAKETI